MASGATPVLQTSPFPCTNILRVAGWLGGLAWLARTHMAVLLAQLMLDSRVASRSAETATASPGIGVQARD